MGGAGEERVQKGEMEGEGPVTKLASGSTAMMDILEPSEQFESQAHPATEVGPSSCQSCVIVR